MKFWFRYFNRVILLPRNLSSPHLVHVGVSKNVDEVKVVSFQMVLGMPLKHHVNSSAQFLLLFGYFMQEKIEISQNYSFW